MQFPKPKALVNTSNPVSFVVLGLGLDLLSSGRPLHELGHVRHAPGAGAEPRPWPCPRPRCVLEPSPWRPCPAEARRLPARLCGIVDFWFCLFFVADFMN